MDKAIVKEMKSRRWKKKEDKWLRVVNLGTTTNWGIQRAIEKCAIVEFTTTWTPTMVKEVGDKFHQNFQASL
jgi:hypothetical protein